MDAKLREFLKSRGVPEDELDKLERGEGSSAASTALRKVMIEETKAAQDQVREAGELMVEMRKTLADIKQSLADIARYDQQRLTLQKLLADTPINGAQHAGLSGILASLKGQT